MLIYHNSQDQNYRRPFGAAAVSSAVQLWLDAEKAVSATLRLWWNPTGEELIPMEREGARFTVTFNVPDTAGLLWYYFIVTDAEGRQYYYGNSPDRLGGQGCLWQHDPAAYQITVYKPQAVPQWYKDALVYQIFPDRFCRGQDWQQRVAEACADEKRKGPRRVIQQDWNDTPFYTRAPGGAVTRWAFFGGTLQGVCEKLDYLRSLGVTAIYLNPIFKAASNHRYDTADYMAIDPMLGDEKGFEEFCALAQERGISVILDGVFSHTGADSVYFDKYGNYGGNGAWENEDSPYRGWYRFTEGEPGYECWWGVTDLPNVEELDPSYSRFICGEEGVVRHWLAKGARGWRLDVADELPDAFIEQVRAALKAEKPDGVLIGEVWEDASNKESYGVPRRYFSGDELDAAMNYPLREMLLHYVLGQCDAVTLCRRMRSLQENYPKENFYGAFNLISGHDRTRVLTVLGEAPALQSEQEKENFRLSPEARKKALKRLKLLSALQYASPGVPCTYYGDEAGMEGYEDPFNRGPYPWGKEDEDLLLHYRVLGQLYQQHPALKDGDYRPFAGKGNVYGFYRENQQEKLLVLANPSGEELVYTAEEAGIRRALELLSSTELAVKDGSFEVTLPAMSAAILLLEEQPAPRAELSRAVGVLCHITSIPGGKLGKSARQFVDFLHKAGMKLWQVLPINPVGLGDSPYFSPSVFAGDPRLIDPKEAVDPKGYKAFCQENAFWLEDHALFCALREKFNNAPWQDWPADARDRTELEGYRKKLKKQIEACKKQQYTFFAQWDALRAYAAEKGISIVGDLPIYVAPDGVDTWAHREDFQLDEQGRLRSRAGCPPDYFSPDGQDWGNPLYNWEEMAKTGYDWWLQRLKACACRYDAIRMDHFRGFAAYYSIPAGKTAKDGQWLHGPGANLFFTAKSQLGELKLLAEDLGSLDAGVYNLLKRTGMPGMNIWQFHAAEMQKMTEEEAASRIFYSGTHDNQTLVGWCKSSFPEEDALEKAEEVIEALYESKAPWVIFQLQDLLDLGDEARMNVPGVAEGNWHWQAEKKLLTAAVARRFATLAKKNKR